MLIRRRSDEKVAQGVLRYAAARRSARRRAEGVERVRREGERCGSGAGVVERGYACVSGRRKVRFYLKD